MAGVAVRPERYVMISADTHGGIRLEGYRAFVDAEYREDFDRWSADFAERVRAARAAIDNSLKALDHDDAAIKTFHDIMDGGLGDAGSRVRALEADGSVGSVIFPGTDFDTLPPFNALQVVNVSWDRLSRGHVWAGARAYNRWLAEFCAEYPDQLAGVMVLADLENVAEAVAEVEWAANAGLRGGIMLPPVNIALPAFSDPRYDPLWSACAALSMPVNVHTGNQSGDRRLYGDDPLAGFVAASESDFWARRPLALFIFGGVFERHPGLRLVFAEMHADWIPAELARLEKIFNRSRLAATRSQFSFTPRGYWERNCAVGATFMTPRESRMRDEIGVGTVMWGTDFPHPEGTYPYTRECLRRTFHFVPTKEVAAMLGENAARVYGFDLKKLQPIADRVGPRVDEVAQPLDEPPAGFRRWALDLEIEDADEEWTAAVTAKQPS